MKGQLPVSLLVYQFHRKDHHNWAFPHLRGPHSERFPYDVRRVRYPLEWRGRIVRCDACR